jgi:hypothetical protein
MAVAVEAPGCGGAIVSSLSDDAGSHGGPDAGSGSGSGSSSGSNGSGSGANSSGSSGGGNGAGSSASSGSGSGGSSGGSSSSSSGGSSNSSGGSNSSSGGSGSSSSGGSSGSSSGGSGSGSSSGSSTGSSSGGTGPLTGSVAFQQCVGSSYCGASGAFYFSADFNYLVSPCTTTTSGACSLVTCPMMSFASSDSAGTLTISGGSIPAGTTLTASLVDGSYGDSVVGTWFSAGDSLSVSATGAMVPAFGPDSITAPPLIALTAPQLADGDAGISTIPTSTDLTLAWSGGQSGATMTLFAGAEVSFSFIDCSWDASLDTGTVPQSLLAQLASLSQNAGQGFVQYGQQSNVTFVAGPYTITQSAMLYTGATVNFQ